MNSASRRAAGAEHGVLTALVARLREAEFSTTAEEVADALWLARWVGPATWPDGPPAPAAAGPGPGDPATGHIAAPDPVAPLVRGPAAPAEGFAALRAPAADGEGADGTGTRQGGSPVRVPTAPTLPDPLALQRALRPLQRFRPPARPAGGLLDEKATAQRAAETGLTVPVLRPARRRVARAQLLMDVSSSTMVWEQTLDELREVLERAGAFREVRVHYLHEDPDGAPGAATTAIAGPAALRPPAQLTDPTGRQITLLFSDCAGPMWRNGAMHRLLHRWAAAMPVAVVQPLPQRMWRNTHLPARPGMLRRPEGPAGRLEFLSPGEAPHRAVAVPVLAPHHLPLETWARLLSGTGELTLRAAAAWVGPDPRPAPAPARRATDVPARERVRAFRRHASPAAVRLAQWLTTTPLELPVMQHLQRAMLPDSGPDVLAEVLLGGLLTRLDGGPGSPAYAFRDGVWAELYQRLAPGDPDLALKHLSRYIEGRWGRTARNFPAMAVAYLEGSVEPPRPPGTSLDDPLLREFAVISTRVLRRSLPRPVTAATEHTDSPGEAAAEARARLERFRQQGTARDLDAGIALFGSASEAERRRPEQAELYASLASALVERWEARRLGEDLKGALRAAEQAVPTVSRAYRTMGDVLVRMAEEVAAAGPDTDAVPGRYRERAAAPGESADADSVRFLLLDDAQRALAEAVAGGGVVARTAAIVRARVLQELAGDFAEQALRLHSPPPEDPQEWYSAMMLRSIGVLDTLVEADPVPPSSLYLRGRSYTMLARRLAGTTDGGPAGAPERVRDAARRARADLTESLARMAHLLTGDRDGEEPRRDASAHWQPDPADLVDGWAALAQAHELAWTGLDTETGLVHALRALTEARAAAENLPAGSRRELLVLRCLEAKASIESRRFHEGMDSPEEALDRAVEAWAEVWSRTPADSPWEPGNLQIYGLTLLRRAQQNASEEDLREAVRLLRQSVAGTSESSPDLAARRMNLGLALLFRFRLVGALVDLYEADWILGAAARGAVSGDVAASAHAVRGQVALELGRAVGAEVRFTEAAAYFKQAADRALAAGSPVMAAAHLMDRAGTLERIAGPDRALTEYRRALAVLTEHGGEQGRVADRIRENVQRLESGDA
ncbi:SAV_2336 N-terminal domain-related protein [Streptomyces sp. NPDC079020]|uniref:SAV_2336 N-terminal domain-related protein n=1 Tax=Streptomyces sp. NPDC079020 TaxID=3365722 RepID=UPI0037D2A7C9